MLVDAWRNSETFDELRLVPDADLRRAMGERPAGNPRASCSANWKPCRTDVVEPAVLHRSIKQELHGLPTPAGDFDSWFIKRAADGSYLRGFESWDQVDGALIRFLISEVMHRLGLIDLAARTRPETPLHFAGRPAAAMRTAEDGSWTSGPRAGSRKSRCAAGRALSTCPLVRVGTAGTG